MMAPAPLIFTDELLAQARAKPEDRRTLIERWAIFPRELARAQLEVAARLVPELQRARVLGPLHSDDDKQAMHAAGVLLLANLLCDQGWAVEHEPAVDGGTPDLRIRKHDADFFVEAKHVPGDFILPPAYGKLRAAVSGITTRTPASFSKIEVDGRAALRGFTAFLRRALADPRPGEQVYKEQGVEIRFELHLPPLERECGVFFTYSPGVVCVDDRSKVRAAIDDKLKSYRFPLIVALHGIEALDMFTDVEDVLYGSRAYEFAVNQQTGESVGDGRFVRLRDAATTRPNSDGHRVRSRLIAVLPFETPITAGGFTVRARLLANPAGLEVSGLKAFRPIPSLLHVGSGSYGYCGADGEPLKPGEEVADEFFLEPEKK